MAKNDPFVIYRFWTNYSPDPKDPAKFRSIDMVEIGPVGLPDKLKTPHRISDISRVQDAGGSENPAIAMAHIRWNFIQPRYEAWKRGQELPESGTPLAAWNGLTSEQAEVLKGKGIRTIEQVASMTEQLIVSTPFPNMRATVLQAKRFIDSADQVRVAADLAQKDEQISAMKAQIDELAEMIAATKGEKRGPGRPRKTEDQAAA
jgi:hypothetical protein